MNPIYQFQNKQNHKYYFLWPALTINVQLLMFSDNQNHLVFFYKYFYLMVERSLFLHDQVQIVDSGLSEIGCECKNLVLDQSLILWNKMTRAKRGSEINISIWVLSLASVIITDIRVKESQEKIANHLNNNLP